MRKLAFAFLFFLFALPAFAQDVPVNCSNPTCTITPSGGLPWSQGNQIFVFRPIDPRVSIYIFVHNLNPSSAHTSQTITVWQTPFNVGTAPSLSQNSSRWTQDIVTQNSTAGASCNNVNANNDLSIGASGLGSCYVNTMFAAQVAIRITGAAAQAGSPDNFELAVIQEIATPGGQTPGAQQNSVQGLTPNGSTASGNPVLVGGLDTSGNARDFALDTGGGLIFSAQNNSLADGQSNTVPLIAGTSSTNPTMRTFPAMFNGLTWDRIRGTAKTGLSDVPAIQMFSDGSSQAFVSSNFTFTNPATGSLLQSINANSGSHSVYFDHVTISCSAACTVNVETVTALGTTCGAGAIVNQKLGSGTASTAANQIGTCTTNPTVGNNFLNGIFVPAGGIVTIDLRGFIAPNATTQGLELIATTFTGTINGYFAWYEQ